MNRNAVLTPDMLRPAPVGGGFSMENYWVWCGSVIRAEDGRYHMFASRWPKTLPFHPGWGVASEIVRAVSDTPEGPYTFQEVVLPARGAGYWDGRSTHNPTIRKIGDKYVLFYVGTTHPFSDVKPGEVLGNDSYKWLAARSNKRTGAAWSDSLEGPWHRMDHPLMDVRPGHMDDFLVSNPAPCICEDGSCLMIYKARTWRKPPYDQCGDCDMYSDMKIFAAKAPSWEGPYTRCEEPLFQDVPSTLEDPFVWQTDDGFSMLIKDCYEGCAGERGALVQAHSRDGLHWEVTPGVAVSRTILWDDGETRTMGNVDRPFLLFDENGNATHLFVAVNNGAESYFATMTHSWNACIPLK